MSEGQETSARQGRIHGIVYSCDSREELAERIVALEDLALDLADRWPDGVMPQDLRDRIEGLVA